MHYAVNTLRAATLDDAATIAAIYNPYIANTTVSFEVDPVSANDMAERIQTVQAAGLPWLVAELDRLVVGYAYAAPWRARPAYRGSVETSVYLAADQHGKGLGKRLYAALLNDLQTRGLHTAIGGIALPNAASVALHERLGFARVALFAQVGQKFGRYVGVGYWQRHLQDTERDRRRHDATGH